MVLILNEVELLLDPLQGLINARHSLVVARGATGAASALNKEKTNCLLMSQSNQQRATSYVT